MMLPTEGYLLRIFIGESDRHDGELLHEWIVTKARSEGLAGATVLRGMLGFGSRLHSFKSSGSLRICQLLSRSSTPAKSWRSFSS